MRDHRIQLRTWSNLVYLHPKVELLAMTAVSLEIADWEIPDETKALRRSGQKQYREKYHAALFACGVIHLMGWTNLMFSMTTPAIWKPGTFLIPGWKQVDFPSPHVRNCLPFADTGESGQL